MKRNLTLSIDKEIIALSKKFAKETGRSLSYIVENHLKSLVDNRMDKDGYSPKLKRLIGAVKLPENFDFKR